MATWPDTLYTTRDTCSSCAVTRTVPDRASDHTYERWFRRGFCIGDSPCRSWKWTVTYRIGFSVSVPLFGVVWTVSCSYYTRYLIDMKGYPVYGVNSVKTLYYNCRKYRIYPNKYHSALIFHASNRLRLFEGGVYLKVGRGKDFFYLRYCYFPYRTNRTNVFRFWL